MQSVFIWAADLGLQHFCFPMFQPCEALPAMISLHTYLLAGHIMNQVSWTYEWSVKWFIILFLLDAICPVKTPDILCAAAQTACAHTVHR